jgi:hypothetical protein
MDEMDQYTWDGSDPEILPGRKSGRRRKTDAEPEVGGALARSGGNQGPSAAPGPARSGNVLRKPIQIEADDAPFDADTDGKRTKKKTKITKDEEDTGEPTEYEEIDADETGDVDGKTTPRKKRKTGDKKNVARVGLRSLLSYRWIMKNMTFFLFLAVLAVIYIYNGHYADKIVRDINKTNKELKELQYEYKTLKSEVMFRSKQSELARAVEPFGLKELTQPPVVLVDSVKGNN